MITTDQERALAIQIEGIRGSVQAQRSAIESVQVDVRRISDGMPAVTILADAQVRNDAVIKELLVNLTELRTKVDKAYAVAGAVLLLGGSLVGLAWNQLQNAQQRETAERMRIESTINPAIQGVDERVRKLEIHGAGDPDRPYTR